MNKLDPALLYDAIEKQSRTLARASVVCPSLRPAGHRETITGPASTLRLRRVASGEAQGRKRIMESYDNLSAGNILVVEVAGDPGGGVIGDLVAHRLAQIGLLGAVVDGPIRDVSGILSSGFPVWARDVVLSGMSADELQVETGVEVVIGGVPVAPGDLVSAGPDGICVVRKDHVAGVLSTAEVILQAEGEAHQRIAAGCTILEAYPTIRQ